jgi:hypothetical protein
VNDPHHQHADQGKDREECDPVREPAVERWQIVEAAEQQAREVR